MNMKNGSIAIDCDYILLTWTSRLDFIYFQFIVYEVLFVSVIFFLLYSTLLSSILNSFSSLFSNLSLPFFFFFLFFLPST